MDQFLTSAGALALVKAVVDFLKYLRARDTNGFLTQAAVWVAGIGTVFLVKASDFADTFSLGGQITLDNANGGTLILAGLGLGSAAMLTTDFKKALDRNDTASKPDLVPTSSHTPEPDPVVAR